LLTAALSGRQAGTYESLKQYFRIPKNGILNGHYLTQLQNTTNELLHKTGTKAAIPDSKFSQA
jgi:hypothetical protein